MKVTVPCAGVPWWPFALTPEPVRHVAAAVGRLTVHGIDKNQLILELEFDLAENGLASLTCLQHGTEVMGAGWAPLSPCTHCRTRAFVGSTVPVLPCLPCLQPSQAVRMSQFLEDTTGLVLGCSQQQVLSGTKAQPLVGCLSRQDGWTKSRNLKPD